MPLILLLALALALAAGCSSGPSAHGTDTTVAFAIRRTGDVQPTEQQLGNAVRALQHHLTKAGYRLADTPQSAHFIVNAEFVASAVDPTGGHLKIISLEPSSAFMRTISGERETEESRQMRERLRDIERWIDMQTKTRPGEGGP